MADGLGRGEGNFFERNSSRKSKELRSKHITEAILEDPGEE